MMAHIEMKAMEIFPIGKLSYDLKLELLENMDPRDVVELANVNRGFRSIAAREPWRIFGKHVDLISICAGNQQSTIEIKKFSSKIWIFGDNQIWLKLSGSRSHLRELKSNSTLLSKIRSSQKLTLSFSSEDQGQGTAQLPVKLLRNLDSVSKLSISIWDAEVDIEKYLTILTLNHIHRATFEDLFSERNEQMLRVLSNFLKTRLKHCSSIKIRDYSLHCPFWYESLSKISTEMILLVTTFRPIEMDFRDLVNRIVTEGIPSSNPEATVLLWVYNVSQRAENSIMDLLSRTPGIRQIPHEDRGEVGESLEKLLLDKMIPERSSVLDFDQRKQRKDLREGVYFTRLIDSNRKCIYMTDPYDSFFLAKYIPIG